MSSSSSSSDEEDFSVISLLDGSGGSPVRKKPRLTSREPPPPPPETAPPTSQHSDSSEFDLQLPAIFQHDAVRNEQLHRLEEDLQRQIRDEELKTRRDYDELMAKKRRLIAELNDNGSLNTRTFTLDHDGPLIERLIKESQHRSAWDDPHRHFYFLSTVHAIDLQCDVPFPVTGAACHELAKGTQSRSGRRVRPVLPYLINNVLCNISSTHELASVNSFLERAIRQRESVPAPVDSLRNHLAAIGASIDFITPRKDLKGIPLKLGQFVNHMRLSLARLAIVLNYHLVGGPSAQKYDQIMEAFILTLCDFNANKQQPLELASFISSVFPGIVRVFSPSVFTDSFVRQDFCFKFTLIMKYCIKPYIYGQKSPDVRKHEYELRFNVLRLVDGCFSSGANDYHAISSRLCLMFLVEDETLLPEDDHALTPTSPSLQALLANIRCNNIVESFEHNRTEDISEFYLNCYRVELLRLVLVKPFKNNHTNLNADPGKYEAVRTSNVKRLTTLTTQLNELRNYYHSIIRDITYIDTRSIYDREEVARRATAAYHTVNYIHNKFEKDLRLITKDFFYSS